VPPTQPISTARTYFEHIRDQPDPFAFLSNIPVQSHTVPFFEEEWLDFKGKPQDERDARKIWSKALSGYANITDGLVVWGIDARKMPPRNIDAASGLRMISDPHVFESQLRDWVRDATNPPVVGVEYQSYLGPSGEGFVVCLIPESSHKPHRAEFADKQYYYRAGDDFLPAEPGLLRTLFYPQIRPNLAAEVTLRFQLNPTDLAPVYRSSPLAYNKVVNSPSYMYFDVMLNNTGAATAKDTYVIVQASDDLNFHPGADWDTRQNPRGKAAFQARRSLHPGEVVELFSASFQKEFGNNSHPGGEVRPHFSMVTLQILIYAEGVERQEVAVEFRPEDLDTQTCSVTKQGMPVM
jgi:hypothetical protein